MYDKDAFKEPFDTEALLRGETADFVRRIEGPGYVIVKDALPAAFLAQCKSELMRAIEIEAKYHNKGTTSREYAMVLVCPLYGRTFFDLFDIPVVCAGFNAVLGPGCITYAYTSSSMPPHSGNYSLRIHVDQPRIIPGYRTNIGALFLLDDFNEDNGATWVLEGSQYREDEPSKEEFYRDSMRLIAPAGTIFFFDPRLWHAGGANHTDKWRHCVTLNICRPWMKQRLDIPRALSGIDLTGVSENALQKLGFRAQPPASYEEFFAPFEERKFRQKTE